MLPYIAYMDPMGYNITYIYNTYIYIYTYTVKHQELICRQVGALSGQRISTRIGYLMEIFTMYLRCIPMISLYKSKSLCHEIPLRWLNCM